MQYCDACGILRSKDLSLPDGVWVERFVDRLSGSVRVVAFRRFDGAFKRYDGGRYAKGFSLSREFIDDTAGSKPLEAQLQDPAVMDEVDRLTRLAIDSVVKGEQIVAPGEILELDFSPRPR